MKNKTEILFVSVAMLWSVLACAALTTGSTPQETTSNNPLVFDVPTPTPTSTPVPLTCPVVTDEIVHIAVSAIDIGNDLILDDDISLITYRVSGDEIVEPQYETFSDQFQNFRDDWDGHARIWDQFRTLIPVDQRTMLAEFIISTDGRAGLLAAVGQTDEDPNLWILQVDIVDTEDKHELTYTLLHEFGHLLTLNSDQVPPSLAMFNNPNDENVYFKEVSACPNYFPGEGCAKADSYIDDFFHRFWRSLYDEWNEVNHAESADEYYDLLTAFYEKYEDRFVTDYAATNPEEDIAETWTFFVLSQKPEGDTIAEQKILFFYQYPELVQLRESIIENLCLNFQ